MIDRYHTPDPLHECRLAVHAGKAEEQKTVLVARHWHCSDASREEELACASSSRSRTFSPQTCLVSLIRKSRPVLCASNPDLQIKSIDTHSR